ncbi:Zn-ribbon domain-containing OB-fold protein [Variovorax sp. M-6]|uniref:Zn-ribbon domain-containing OB-fold protein n=1 Tax=Variovorax sp. M-6 TaxID=3233041 RepID=UPI003F94DF97
MHPDHDYSQFLDEGRFMIQRCLDSGRHLFYPRVAEPGSGSTRLEWVEPSGLGVVYSVTVIHVKPPAAPYNVVLVDLDEGPRMMSRVDGIPAQDVRIGLRVRAQVIREADGPLVVFEPATEAQP